MHEIHRLILVDRFRNCQRLRILIHDSLVRLNLRI